MNGRSRGSRAESIGTIWGGLTIPNSQISRPAVCEMRRPLRGTRTRSRYNALCATQDADRAGIHRTYVSDIERGKRNPTVTVVEKLAGPLGVASGRLLD